MYQIQDADILTCFGECIPFTNLSCLLSSVDLELGERKAAAFCSRLQHQPIYLRDKKRNTKMRQQVALYHHLLILILQLTQVKYRFFFFCLNPEV